MQEITQKVAIVQNGSALFQFIDKILRNTPFQGNASSAEGINEGYEIVGTFDSLEDLNRAYNMAYIDFILYDLKTNNDFQILLNHRKKQATQCKLSPREKEVMSLLAKGLVYKEIAETLDITLGTLKQYIHIIYKKLGVSNKTEAINIYFNR